MKPARYEGGFWPTRQQRMLLKASLLKGEEAIDSWLSWKSGVDIDRIDYGSQRLLPLLYKNLYDHGVEDPLMDRFKGVYRRTWYANQMIFHVVAKLLNTLHAASIRTMLLKGAALILLYYRDYGLRPMSDFDVLVPTNQASSAVHLLVESGWTPDKDRPPRKFDETFFSLRNSHNFKGANGLNFDLHWHVLLECCREDADDDFWDGAVATRIDDVATRALNPADQLLHVCTHGARWSDTPPLRWIADAMHILNNSEVEWNRLVEQARKRSVLLVMRDTMSYLHSTLAAPVPMDMFEGIKDTSVSKMERIEYSNRHRPQSWSDHCSPFGALKLIYSRYRWLRQSGGPLERSPGFLRFLKHNFGAYNLWQLSISLLRKVTQRIHEGRHIA